MRERLFHLVALITLVLSPAASSSAATAHSPVSKWTVATQPARLVNGAPVLFRVTTPKPVRTLSASWLGHEIAFSFDADHKSWFALAGVSLETKPGAYPIELYAETSSGPSAGQAISFEKTLRVALQRYPRHVVPLTVPGHFTEPSPEDLRQIEQDKGTKAEAFKTLSQGREWEGSFAAPVSAEIS